MQTYLMHVYIHRHFIYLSCTDWDIFIQEKMGDRYWQAQDIRKAAKVCFRSFGMVNQWTLNSLKVQLIVTLQCSAVPWYLFSHTKIQTDFSWEQHLFFFLLMSETSYLHLKGPESVIWTVREINFIGWHGPNSCSGLNCKIYSSIPK